MYGKWPVYNIDDLLIKKCQVGGFNQSEKYQSVGIILPNIWKNKIHVPNHQPEHHGLPLIMVIKNHNAAHYHYGIIHE